MSDWIEDRASIPLILSLPVVFHASRIAIQGTTAGPTHNYARLSFAQETTTVKRKSGFDS